MMVDARGLLTYRSYRDDPLSAEAIYGYQIRQSRDHWNATVECDLRVSCNAQRFRVKGEFRALEDGGLVADRPVDFKVQRRWV